MDKAIHYYQTKDILEYKDIIEQLTPELGKRFPKSIENWCGIGQRPYHLPTWEIFVVRVPGASQQPIGLFSFYQQKNDPAEKYWIGWIGVLPAYRRNRYGMTFLNVVETLTRQNGATELWVYTDIYNEGALGLYRSFGMKEWGKFSDTEEEQASADEYSVVLIKRLSG